MFSIISLGLLPAIEPTLCLFSAFSKWMQCFLPQRQFIRNNGAFRIHVSEGRSSQGEVRLWGTECTVLSLCLKMQRVCWSWRANNDFYKTWNIKICTKSWCGFIDVELKTFWLGPGINSEICSGLRAELVFTLDAVELHNSLYVEHNLWIV